MIFVINPHDAATIAIYQKAIDHVGGACACDAVDPGEPSSPECLRALELACAASQDETIDALQRAMREVETVARLYALEERLRTLEAASRSAT